MRISDWSSDVCSSDLDHGLQATKQAKALTRISAASGRSPAESDSSYVRISSTLIPALVAEVQSGQAPAAQSCTGNGCRPATEEGYHPRQPVRLAGAPYSYQRTPGSDREALARSEEHTSELQSLMSITYDAFCLKKTN